MKSKQNNPLLTTYLIVGEDELKRETALKRLQARFSEDDESGFNTDVFDAVEVSAEQVVTACNTLPFGDGQRLVLVKSVNRYKKADTDVLCSYIQQPNPTTVLCLVAEKLPSNTKLYKAVSSVGKNAVIDCTPLKRRPLQGALAQMARTHGITITDGAASTLIDCVGTNTVTLDMELRKLALAHRGNDPVNESEVLQLVAKTQEAKPWELVDAFAARSIARTLSLRRNMPSVTVYALLPMCVTRIRELLTAKALMQRGAVGELARTLKVPDWRVKNHVGWARCFTNDELIEALRSSRDAEQAMKSGSDPETVFTEWVLATLSHK